MSRGQFYLDKSNAKIWGVCAGIADYTGVDAFWIRLAAVLVTLMGSGVPILVYIAVAWLADSRPMGLYDEADEARLLRRMERRRARGIRSPYAPRSAFHDISLDRASRSATTARSEKIAGDLDDFDRRVRDLETHYSTSSSSRLAAEIDSLR
ncbi:PspC domain-containing protein [Novosphingobium sp. 9]|uniref:PspC domain-containing protein n=1 Tax=Novosphingobium sp. 9 TaxID=2025349 RepID=UPI0021B60D8C|nr:PspC domain-containing protein [Novosphingobium sp. 9]